MSKFSNLKLRYKIGVGVATGAAVLAGGGGAFAYFTASGSGSATGSTGSTNTGVNHDQNAWTVAVTGDSTHQMYPGATAVANTASLPFTITNSSPGNLGLQNVAIAIAQDGSGNIETVAGSTASAVSGCKAVWYNLDATSGPTDANASNTSAGLTYSSAAVNPHATTVDVAAAGVVSGTATIQMLNASPSASQDACQGKTPAVTVTAS